MVAFPFLLRNAKLGIYFKSKVARRALLSGATKPRNIFLLVVLRGVANVPGISMFCFLESIHPKQLIADF